MATKMNKLLALFLAITMLLSMTVFAVDPSIDGSVELICGMEEHIHNESCVLTVASCAFGEDASHVHTDDCYMSISVCEKAAHIHNLDCIKTAEDSALIPGSELYVYPELGHAAYEEAKDFNERVFRFLEE